MKHANSLLFKMMDILCKPVLKNTSMNLNPRKIIHSFIRVFEMCWCMHKFDDKTLG